MTGILHSWQHWLFSLMAQTLDGIRYGVRIWWRLAAILFPVYTAQALFCILIPLCTRLDLSRYQAARAGSIKSICAVI